MREARVVSIDAIPLAIPFRRPFAHHLRTHAESRPLLVRVRLSDGKTGWGESQPRPYVTGETIASARAAIEEAWRPRLVGEAVRSLEQTAALLRAIDFASEPAAFCGLELALLDAAGRIEDKNVVALFGGVTRSELTYDGAVVGHLPAAAFGMALMRIRAAGKRTVKIKVGLDDDVLRVAAARRILGNDVRIIIDANAAWTVDEAIARIRALEPYHIALVEQPVAKDDVPGLRRVRDAVAVPLMADEALCTLQDAETLIAHRAAAFWNVRLGKCGGLLASHALVERAHANAISCQLGVMVGETGILGAAGRLFAASHSDLTHLELDTSGNASADVLRGAPAILADHRLIVGASGPGLGIEVDEARVESLRAEKAAA
jgi:L-Ala-D/L-Glu epimerase / N-acetyl-D-glutamate racemase